MRLTIIHDQLWVGQYIQFSRTHILNSLNDRNTCKLIILCNLDISLCGEKVIHVVSETY